MKTELQKKSELNARRRAAYAAKKRQQAAAKAQPENAQAAKENVTIKNNEQQAAHKALFRSRIQNEKRNIYRRFGEDKSATLIFLDSNAADEKSNAAVRLARADVRKWAEPDKPMPY